MSTYDVSTKYCVCCEFWLGPRQLDTAYSPPKVKAEGITVKGKCANNSGWSEPEWLQLS